MAFAQSSFGERWTPIWLKKKELGAYAYQVHQDGQYKTGRTRGRALFADAFGQPIQVLEAMELVSKQGKNYWMVRNDADPTKETPKAHTLADVYG